ncbi:MAG TPA: hypothetical protein VFZ59_25690 [Verrucomicrobiae bacterium]|nr:hypothetical protein [Verrucomicrobiae bacterium]
MGVPVGSGQRMGLDRDLDGILDFDEPQPQLQLARVSNQAVLNWPLSAVGYRLEQTTNLASSPWSDDTNAVEIVNQFNFVTNNSSDATKFFRLRRQ